MENTTLLAGLTTVTDAWGRDVRDLKPCARCGQYIKYQYEFEGKIYGSECIKAVTGEPKDYWVIRDGKIDKEATAKREADKAAEHQAWLDKKAARDAAMAAQAVINIERYSDLLAVLDGSYGDFCADMAQKLRDGRTVKDAFSSRMISILCDIFAKSHGRRNSKAYTFAYDNLYARFDEDMQ